jgi:chitinase
VLGAYLPGHDATAYLIELIPADVVTHLFYAFATIDPEGHLTLPAAAPAHFEALAALRRAHPRFRMLTSIGGWGADGFSDAALTERSRAALVDDCRALFSDLDGDWDGVDLDWEFPVSGGPDHLTHRPEDRHNATLLAQQFHRRLGPDRLLTAALPAGRLEGPLVGTRRPRPLS